MIKIVLVDDHVIVRLGLVEAIETHPEMKVIGDFSSPPELFERYQELAPDVVVMDCRMPDMDGVEGTRILLERFPDAKVIMLSVYEGEEDVWRAVNFGVKGYLTKGADASDLIDAITAVKGGESYFPARIVKKLKHREGRKTLSKREMTVLRLLVEGASNKEISDQLGISINTVKLHASNMMAKLGVNDRTQAAIAAVQRGIVHLDD